MTSPNITTDPNPTTNPTVETQPTSESAAIERKADRLEEAFDGLANGEALEEIRHSLRALKARSDSQAMSTARPPLDGTKAADSDPARAAFVDKYLRRGIDSDSGVKGLTIGTDSEGGYAVPREVDSMLLQTMASMSPIRSIATVVQTGSSKYRKLVATKKTASNWVAETADRPETDTRSFVEISPYMGELYANPAASQAMLDDAAFDVENWLVEEIAQQFASAEGAAFVNGDGDNKPKGFLTYATSATGDATRPFGTLQYVPSGKDGDFSNTKGPDSLIDLVHSLRPCYRQGAVWVMNSDTLAMVRRLKDPTGRYLWQPSLIENQLPTVLGYPIVEAEHMPDIGNDSLSIAFGNFRAGYLIADRGETSLLRDPYTNKPFVHFYATKRVGGVLMNSEAIKLMKFSVT